VIAVLADGDFSLYDKINRLTLKTIYIFIKVQRDIAKRQKEELEKIKNKR
jgi:hypothetical protein